MISQCFVLRQKRSRWADGIESNGMDGIGEIIESCFVLLNCWIARQKKKGGKNSASNDMRMWGVEPLQLRQFLLFHTRYEMQRCAAHHVRSSSCSRYIWLCMDEIKISAHWDEEISAASLERPTTGFVCGDPRVV
jgi:hypothetical protein